MPFANPCSLVIFLFEKLLNLLLIAINQRRIRFVMERSIYNTPLLRGLFRLLTRPRVVRYFLERTWGSKDIDEAL